MSSTNILKKLKNHIHSNIRKRHIEQTIGNIGKITENDLKIVCNVDQKKLDDLKQASDILIIDLNNYTQDNNSILEKPVLYIFDQIQFTTRIVVNSPNVSVLFKNCTFTRKINIYSANSIIFDDNSYIISDSAYPYSGCYIDVSTNSQIKRLSFINEKHIDTSWKSNKNYTSSKGQCFKIDLLEIKNSMLTSNDPESLFIDTKKTIIDNSSLLVKELYFKSKNISFSNSFITSIEGIIIENENCDFEGNLNSPIVIYNGVSIPNKNKLIEQKEIKNARIDLIRKLKCIKDYCNYLNNKKIKDLRKQLNKTKINTILNRK